MKHTTRSFVRPLSYTLTAILLAVLLWTQRHDVIGAARAAGSANVGWVVAGLGCMALSVGFTSLVYMLLSPKRLLFMPTALVQSAGLFVNKVLPAGSGAMGVSYLYLRNNKLDKLSASLVVVLNNLFGFVGHALLLGTVLLLFSSHMPTPTLAGKNLAPSHLLWPAVVAGALVIVLLTTIMFGRVQKFFTPQRVRSLRLLLSRPGRMAGALGCSVLLTLCYVGSLYTAGASVGQYMDLPMLLLVLSLSVLATVILPAPGGIGAAEAGMYVALRAFDVPAAEALLVSVLYRVITFWLPLIFGIVAFAVVEKRRLISHKL